MTLDDYKKDDGYEYDGCFYQNADDLLQTGMFGFCGCGRPSENLLYVLGGLELIDEPSPNGTREQFNAWWTGYHERVLKHFGSDEAAYFFYYWADKEELTEHGGGVPGWLGEKGRNILMMLREWKTANAPLEPRAE